jgi:IPT/TIG domain
VSTPATITVTAPGAALSVGQGATFPAAWRTDAAVTEGEFSVWLVTPENGWYGPYLVPVNGTADYAADVPASAPAGDSYRVYVYWRPEGGSWSVYGFYPTLPEVTITPPPTVTGLAPASGPDGTSVLITGTGFTVDTNWVKFGAATAGLRFDVLSDTEIIAVAPPGSGTVHVTVSTPGGTSVASPADEFTYDVAIGPPGGGGGSAPTVASVAPATAVNNDGGDQVTVNGSGFASAEAVAFMQAGGTVSISGQIYQVLSDAQMVVITPPGSGVSDIVVTNAYGISAVVAGDQYTYPAGLTPVLTSFTPLAAGEGALLTMTGSNFLEADGVTVNVTQVTFRDAGGAEVPAVFRVDSNTSMVVSVPQGTVSGLISIYSRWGSNTRAGFVCTGTVYDVIQATANGKNTMHHSLLAPTPSDANIAGDVWFRYDALSAGGHVIAQWTGGGGSAGAYVWTTALLSDALFTNISCAKLAAGTINVAIELTSATITGGVIRTANAPQRTQLDNTFMGLKCYSGVAGEVTPGTLQCLGGGGGGNLMLIGPDFGGGRPALELLANSSTQTVSLHTSGTSVDLYSDGAQIYLRSTYLALMASNVFANGNVKAVGLISCQTAYTMAGENGIAIQGNDGTSWRLYYNVASNKLAIRKVGAYTTVFQTAILNG